MSFYDVFGLPPYSSISEIAYAYQQLSKYYDPLSNADPMKAQRKLLELKEAYSVLGNETRKQNYDERLRKLEKEQQAGEFSRNIRRKIRRSGGFSSQKMVPMFATVFVIVNIVAVIYFIVLWFNQITNSRALNALLTEHLGGFLLAILVFVLAFGYLILIYIRSITSRLS